MLGVHHGSKEAGTPTNGGREAGTPTNGGREAYIHHPGIYQGETYTPPGYIPGRGERPLRKEPLRTFRREENSAQRASQDLREEDNSAQRASQDLRGEKRRELCAEWSRFSLRKRGSPWWVIPPFLPVSDSFDSFLRFLLPVLPVQDPLPVDSLPKCAETVRKMRNVQKVRKVEKGGIPGKS